MVEPLVWTIAKGVAVGILLVEAVSLASYCVLAWLYRRVR